MKSKFRIPLIFLTAFFMFPNIAVYAEQKKGSITAEESAEKIYVDLTEYKEIELNDNKTKLDNYTIKRYLEEAERQLESNDKNIKETKSKLNSTDISNEEINHCRYQIEYLNIYGFELQRNKNYYEMQNKLSELYEEYSEKIVKDQKNNIKYETYKKLCEIKLCKSQEEYLKMFSEQKKNELNVIQKSFKIGYATENEVLSAKAGYEAAKSELAACENNYSNLVNSIEKNTGYKLDKYSLTLISSKKYESEKYLKQFKNQVFYSEYYLKQNEIYKKYFKLLDELTKQMDKKYSRYKFLFGDNEDFFDRTYKYISDEKKYYENESEIYKLNSEKYSSESELYITESCGNLNTLLSRRTAKLSEIKAAESSYEIARGLLNEGRISELNLTEARVNLQKNRYELSQIETEILVTAFALDNGIII